MRRIDELLTEASERGDRMGPARLIEHLERRLEGEREVVVGTRTRRGTVVTTIERPTPTETPRRPWKRLVIALGGFAIVVAAVVVAVAMIGGGEDEFTEAEAIATFQTVAADIAAGDAGASPLTGDDLIFFEWQVAMDASPQFTNCRTTGELSNGTGVACTATMGPDYFFSQVLGDNLTTSVTGVVFADEQVTVTSWPPPDGLVEADRAFREWIRIVYPELEDRMFGTDLGGVINSSREAAELHMQYLDEYLAYLALPPAPTSEAVMERILNAIQATDPTQFSDLSIPLASQWNRFLDWNSALGLDPVIGDCRASATGAGVTTFDCNATSGMGYFFSAVLGDEIEGPITVNVADDGLVMLAAWPAPPPLRQVQGEFRDWIRAVHPEVTDRMFDSDAIDGYSKITQEAAVLHMHYLDEYLEYLATDS